MTEQERIAAIAAELEAAAAGSEAQAVLQSGAEVVECARLAANRPGLYCLAATMLRASLQPGRSISASPMFSHNSEYFLTDVVMDERPRMVPEVEVTAKTQAGDFAFAGCLVTIAVLTVIGLVSVVGWVF